MGTTACWQCGAPVDDALICQQCHSLQPPPADYFCIFGIERRLDLDVDALQQAFYRLSRQLHPDRYTRRSPREQQYALEATAVLNDAWRVLRDPVQRAEYVLSQEGFDIGEQRSKDVPPELLEEVFELNMALEELRGGDESVRPQLESARINFERMQEQADSSLRELFGRYDVNRERETLAAIRGALNRRRYVRNLIREVDKELHVHVPD
jgi:molecular chaperone HscB